MPQAIDRLLAMPVTRIFLPVRSSSIGTDRNGLHSRDSPPSPAKIIALSLTKAGAQRCVTPDQRRPAAAICVPRYPRHPVGARVPRGRGELSPIRGGREAAEDKLRRIDARRYAKSRNHLKGAVTGLSPYIRHGVLTLAEVRDSVFAQIRNRDEGGKLINELGWRDFWQRMWLDLGDGINDDQEPFKTAVLNGS